MISSEKIERTSNALLSALFLMLSDHEEWGNVLDIMTALHYSSYKFNRAVLDLDIITPEQWREIKEHAEKGAEEDFDSALTERVKGILAAKQSLEEEKDE